MDVMEECIPMSLLPDRKNLPRLTKETIQLIHKRNALFKQAKKEGSSLDYNRFKSVRNRVVSLLRHNKQEFFASLNPRCPKDFWKSIKAINPSKGEYLIPPLLDSVLNETVSESEDKVSLLNNTFCKQPPLHLNDIQQTDLNDPIDSILCTEEEVYKLLCSLDTNKANGSDNNYFSKNAQADGTQYY